MDTRRTLADSSPLLVHAHVLRFMGAATGRFRRVVDAIIAHNFAQTDPLHLWYINAAAVRDLVGGRNDAVQAYLEARKSELAEHHERFTLTPRQNRKNMNIADEITVK